MSFLYDRDAFRLLSRAICSKQNKRQEYGSEMNGKGQATWRLDMSFERDRDGMDRFGPREVERDVSTQDGNAVRLVERGR